MRAFLSQFRGSLIVAAIGLTLASWWGGLHGLFITVMLVLLEIGFSFDNAVVNATVLRHMNHVWQKRFLTWGMLICVFGMYYLFPIIIVSVATGLNPIEATHLALTDAEAYGAHIASAHRQISAFGGMFLLMVFLHFILDAAKTVHWIAPLERKLTALGRLESIEAGFALLILLALYWALPIDDRAAVLVAGMGGVVLHIAVRGLTAILSPGEGSAALHAGLAGFLYLQVLDASFSLDAVVGSFAISSDILIILIGLTVGAMFVRSLTIYLVRQGTLEQYIYLEHGAYYAIGSLAVIMLVDIQYDVPQVITGLIGLVLIGLSLVSSLRHLKK